jgi:hypothetical protein
MESEKRFMHPALYLKNKSWQFFKLRKISSTHGTTEMLSYRIDIPKRDKYLKSDLNEISISLQLLKLTSLEHERHTWTSWLKMRWTQQSFPNTYCIQGIQ